MVSLTMWNLLPGRLCGTAVVLALLGLGLAGVASAQSDFSCSATVNRTTVPQGENVVLTVTAQGDMGWSAEFTLPTLPQVRVQSGGTNQSMSVVNGKSRTSVSRTWYLTVEGEDDFTIAPVRVTAAGKECKTDAIGIKVTAPLPPKQVPPADSGNRVPGPGVPGPTGRQSGQPGDDIFLTLDVDHENPWVGQQIILTFRYWRRIQPWNNPSYTAPRTEGFWREDLGAEKNYRKVVQGRAYNVTEIRYALFPTRSGELVIDPAELTFPEGVFDRFFNSRRARRGPNVLRTRSLTIDVRELPAPRPENFSGIVASRLSLQTEVDAQTVGRGEALGLKATLVADGFLKGFGGLEIPAPAGARLHDATESFQSRPTHDRMSGVITVEKVIVPGQEGTLDLAPLELSWFDSLRGGYRVTRTSGHRVTVTPSDLPLSGDDSSGFLRSEINRLSDDLAFIHPVPSRLARNPGPWLGGSGWWIALLLPLVLLAVLRFYLARLSADRRDPAARRARLALSTARAELAAAVKEPKTDGRLTAIARSIAGYVADCQDRPAASVGVQEVRDFGRMIGLAEVGERLAAILHTCDSARFGGENQTGESQLAAEVESLLRQVDEIRKKGIGSAASVGPLATVLLAGVVHLAVAASPAIGQVPVAGERPGADPVRLVAEGNQAYTEGNTARAQELYLQARDLGVNDAVLHFNLGNAHARHGQLGLAVASYLRARRLDPRDRDVATNLAWVRQHIQDLELTEDELPLFIAEAAAVVAALTLDQWGIVLIIFLWLTAALIGWGWYREEFGNGLRRALLASAAGLVIAAVVTAGRWYHEEVRDEAVVIVAEAEVRSGPAENFPVLFEVHDGLTLNIEGEREGWVRIGLGGEWVGWLPAGSVVSVRLDPERS